MKLQDHRVLLNGIVEYASEVGSVDALFRSVYLHYNIDYPKFFKMDNLCKLAFLSAEILLQGTDVLQKYPSEQIGIILENASSSLEYDRKHHNPSATGTNTSRAHPCSSIPFQISWLPRSLYGIR